MHLKSKKSPSKFWLTTSKRKNIIQSILFVKILGKYLFLCNSIFSKPSSYDLWKITSGLYVSDTLRKAIQKAKLTGMDFEKTSVS